MIEYVAGSLKPHHLHNALNKHQINVAQLAKMSGVSRCTLARWMEGHPIKYSERELVIIKILNQLDENYNNTKVQLKTLPKGIMNQLPTA